MAESALYECKVDDIQYLARDGNELWATVYRPRAEGVFPLIVEVHGGAWCFGDRADNSVVKRALSAHGLVIASVDFRMPPEASYPASIADINYAIRWFKANAAGFGSTPDLVGVMGVSSGGHQAMLVAMRPSDPRYRDSAFEVRPDVTSKVAFAVLCAPVIDPLGRYRFAKALPIASQDREILVTAHEKYWGTETAMAEGSPVMALERNEVVEHPPVLYIQGSLDNAHPREHLDRFVAAYRKAGGSVDLRLLNNASRVFEGEDPDTGVTAEAIRIIVEFVHGLDATRSGGRG